MVIRSVSKPQTRRLHAHYKMAFYLHLATMRLFNSLDDACVALDIQETEAVVNGSTVQIGGQTLHKLFLERVKPRTPVFDEGTLTPAAMPPPVAPPPLRCTSSTRSEMLNQPPPSPIFTALLTGEPVLKPSPERKRARSCKPE